MSGSEANLGGSQAAISASGGWLIAEQSGSLVWLSPANGELLHQRELPVVPSALPAVTDSGLVLVPTAAGVLLVLEPEREAFTSVRVSWAPLRTPLWDAGSQLALVVSGDGVITALDIARWLARRGGA